MQNVVTQEQYEELQKNNPSMTASFDEFCQQIESAVIENGGDQEDANFIAEDAISKFN